MNAHIINIDLCVCVYAFLRTCECIHIRTYTYVGPLCLNNRGNH